MEQWKFDFNYELELVGCSVTRFGDFLDFGQPFKAFCNNLFAQISYILGKFCKCAKIIHFSNEIIFGQLL